MKNSTENYINYYEVLGLTDENCSQQDITKAYIKTIKNTKQNNYSEQELIMINDAYNVLKKPLKRFEYDSSKKMQNTSTYSLPDREINFTEETFKNTIKEVRFKTNELNKLVEDEQKRRKETILPDENAKPDIFVSAYEDAENNMTNYTFLGSLNAITQLNEHCDEIDLKIEKAKLSGNIDEYIRLRDEQRKIITQRI